MSSAEKEPLLRRRSFLKFGAWLGASTAVASADIAFARRMGLEKHRLNPDIMEALGLQAESIAPYISFVNFEKAKELGTSGYNIIPKPTGFAHMFLTMAYFEEGQQGVEKTLKTITKRRVEIVLGQTSFPGAYGEITHPLIAPRQPYKITIQPEYLLSNLNPLSHEMYHVHQFIREGEGKLFLQTASLSAAMYWLSYGLIGSIIDKVTDEEKHTSRRRFLLAIAKHIITLVPLFYATRFIAPHELQAYTQTDESILDTLAADPYFRFNSTDLFDFKK